MLASSLDPAQLRLHNFILEKENLLFIEMPDKCYQINHQDGISITLIYVSDNQTIPVYINRVHVKAVSRLK